MELFTKAWEQEQNWEKECTTEKKKLIAVIAVLCSTQLSCGSTVWLLPTQTRGVELLMINGQTYTLRDKDANLSTFQTANFWGPTDKVPTV